MALAIGREETGIVCQPILCCCAPFSLLEVSGRGERQLSLPSGRGLGNQQRPVLAVLLAMPLLRQGTPWLKAAASRPSGIRNGNSQACRRKPTRGHAVVLLSS